MSTSDTQLTLTVEEAGRLLGISRGAAYRAAACGQIPTIRLGRRLLVPTARLHQLLGLTPTEAVKPSEGPADDATAEGRWRSTPPTPSLSGPTRRTDTAAARRPPPSTKRS